MRKYAFTVAYRTYTIDKRRLRRDHPVRYMDVTASTSGEAKRIAWERLEKQYRRFSIVGLRWSFLTPPEGNAIAKRAGRTAPVRT